MALEKKRRHAGRHRAEELPVRRWLQLSAASAGMGAALLGWSLIGSQTSIASADGGVDGSSAAAGPAASPANGVETRSASSPGSAASSSRDDDGPSQMSRRTARDAAEGDRAEPADAVTRAERRANTLARTPDSNAVAPAGATTGATASVADRLTDSTSVGSRLAQRTATAPDVNGFGTAVTGLFNRPPAEPAAAPGATVKFEFDYTEGAEEWTPERRRELEQAASVLAEYFRAPVPVTITYEVEGDPGDRFLAEAGSDPISGAPGYYNTVVQEKFISGLDLNGPEADGNIKFYFGNDWGLGYQVEPEQYDFVSTAMHEMMHSLGFLSQTDEPGKNTRTNWAIFDRYLVDSAGERPIGADYRFDDAFNPNLIGWNGGMYFGGPNAVAAYGAFVPLFTPDPYQPGSSMSHLDDTTFTGVNAQMMNSAANKAGNDRRFLSAIEQGIMADLGYQVNFQAPAPYAPPVAGAFFGFLILRRRRKPEASDN
ncbi:hypothetical protein [Mycobacterium sp. 852013-51886_SCH5428379]|uniref:hypothetical protein n=1 Tax=Mycobacterium sp. 852013-51886_SCH5428379 TaxID=1834111 RepID=UPI000A6FBCFD|nr:hypothetical protein [Mycobacterium sp. 852013-51886_SCH5428379]